MNWYKISQTTNVSVDMSEYSTSLKNRLEAVRDRDVSEQQRLSTFDMNSIANIEQSLNALGLQNLVQFAKNALMKKDPKQLENLAMAIHKNSTEKRRTSSGGEINAPKQNYFEYSKLTRLIWDYSSHLQMTGGTYRAFTQEDVDSEYNRLIEGTKNSLEQIASNISAAISRIENWSGVLPVIVRSMAIDNDNETGIGDEAMIEFGNDDMAPNFTYFIIDGKLIIDDVLEAGDEEFFTDPRIQSDYFNLVKELRNPGSSSKSGKVLTLYTARPVKDRQLYMGKKTIPSNIFLTDKYESAEGIGRDMGERDIWRLRIDSKWLINTLDGPEKQYQVVGGNEVPVIKMDLISPYEKE